jgi:molybdenum cofactor cytidylyltransferase
MSIAGLVLAAGASLRYGAPKLAESIAGEPLVRRVVRSVLSAGLPAVVVTGPDAEPVRKALDGLDVAFVQNPDAAEGMASSIRAGVAAQAAAVRAVMILPGDQPGTSPDLIRELCRVYRETGAHAVAPVYRGVQGPPVLFSRELFGELTALRGDRGARVVLEAHADSAAFVAIDEPMPRDLDTPEDRDALEALLTPPS